ncbi:MAG TPA: hypothetical protein QGF66_01700 [SAR86 cluster bacterium]|jgi:hypothetical protein|nr:hypothetical protein [SAR86 cluster bacterium]|tara:strand:+ start:764 stop:982 length:219 start_codon:yes stop_codon:yes gene_type:complete
MNALNNIRDIIGSLTGIIVSLVALGVAAGVVFGGGVPFVGGVLDNLLGLVNTLGGEGLVGLIVLAVLLDMYR